MAWQQCADLQINKRCFMFNVHSTQLTASISFILPCSTNLKKTTALRNYTLIDDETQTPVKPHMVPFLRLASRSMTLLINTESAMTCGCKWKPNDSIRRAGEGLKQGWLRLLDVDKHRESHKTSLMVVFVPVKRLVPLITKPVHGFSFRSATNTANFPNGSSCT